MPNTACRLVQVKNAEQCVQLTCGILRDLRQAFRKAWLRVYTAPKQSPRPPQRHAPRTQTVETVEKVPFQKQIFEKWGRNIEKRLVFCVLNNILAIFKPVVGDFFESFSNKGFFDSLVRRCLAQSNQKEIKS